MCGPGRRMGWVWRVHAGAIDGLHWQRGIAVEAMVVLEGRLMVGIVAGSIMPGSIVIVEVLLVVLLVVHVQLAHVG